MDKNIIIIYHNDCLDGFCAAFAAWKKFGEKAEYIGLDYDTPVPEGLKNKEIYTVDFSFPEEITKRLIKENKILTSIDHHISAEKRVKLTRNYIFDLNHSGCVLTWNYFHPGKAIPKLLRQVEDMDLWRFKLPHTSELMSFLDSLDYDFGIWDKVVRDFEKPKKYRDFVEKGKLILEYENRQIKRIIENCAELVEFEGIKTFAVNSPIYNSQIGAELRKKLPPMGIIWYNNGNKIYFSLRSDGTADVSKLAAKFGGGGHKSSSGFILKSGSKLPWKKIKKF